MPVIGARRVLGAAVAGLVAASLPTGLAVAETQPKQPRPQSRKLDSNTAGRYQPPLPPPSPYVERDASKLRFGSTEWWEQMQREGRLGGERP